MDEVKELFNIDWLKEWKRVMCKKMFDNDIDDYCIRPVGAFPCKCCRYHTED